MCHLERPVHVSMLLPIAFLFSSLVGAQTLKHRPPAKPETPAAATQTKTDVALPPAKPELPQGTNLQVEITRHFPLKANEVIEGRLLHPIYAQGRLAIPEGTLVRGTVVALEPERKARRHARLRGDFTPFHAVQVQFDELELPAGAVAISANRAANGAPVLHLATPAASPRQSLVARYWTLAKQQVRDRVAWFTAPGVGDRALQAFYHQLPYHPERIEAHTMWSFDLTAPMALLELDRDPAPMPNVAGGKPERWEVNALLAADLSSATAKAGDPVEALVVEPVYDGERQLVVPQGSVLVGKVSAAKAARSLGRNGKLRFNFQQVRFAEGANQEVQGALAGATARGSEGLTLDAEGAITPRNDSSMIAPLVLTLLAGRAMDYDDDALTVQTGVASNGFGLVGRVVGVAARNRNLAASIGFYAVALSVYENFLQPGRDVVFPKNTRIEIETTPLRAPVIRPDSQ